MDAYYEMKGWNKDGVPTPEKLAELSLDYVSKDFTERGIYAESESVSAEEAPVAEKQE